MISLPFPAYVIDRLGWTLVHSLWQFCAVAVIALALERVLQRRSAEVRYLVLLAAMGIMAAFPVLTWTMLPADNDATPTAVAANEGQPRGPVAAAAAVASDGAALEPRARDAVSQGFVPPVTTLRPTLTERITRWRLAAEVHLRPWLAEIVALWFLGAAMCSLRPVVSWRTVRRLRTSGVSPVSPEVEALLVKTAVRLRLARTVQICQSSLIHAPMVLGSLRPLVLLPASVATGLSPSQLQAVLAHELAHVRRHDYLVNLVQTVIETVFFYHPAVWWLSAKIRHERENCCDDLAVAVVGDRVEFGRALVALAELRGAEPTLALAARGGSFLRRIRRLLDGEPADPALGAGAVLGCGLLAAVIVTALFWAESYADPPPQGDERSKIVADESRDADPAADRTSAAVDKPASTHIWGHGRSSVAWQSGDKVYLVLYANGFLQTGLEESSLPTGEWKFRGHINLLREKRVVRRFELLFSSDEPNTVYLDGKAYVMDAPPENAGTDGVKRTGRLFVLREIGEPLQTDRTLPLKSLDDLDPKQPGSLAFSADLDLHLAETYAVSRELAAQAGWVIAWDKQHPAQHSDGARVARLRVFPDGRIAAWEVLGKPLVETRIPREEVTMLVNWLIDEQHAGARAPMDIVTASGSKRQIYLDPLPMALWDQEAERVAVRRGDRTFDLLAITPDRTHPDLAKTAGVLAKDVIDRLQQLVNAAASAGAAPAGENGAPEEPGAGVAAVDAPLVAGAVFDEATGEPIPTFRVLAGVPYQGTNRPTAVWQPHTIREFAAGRFAWPAQNAYETMKLRIEAPGYETFTTDWLIKKNGPQALDVALKRDPDIELTIVTPGGQPAVGAVVAIAMSNRTVRLKGKTMEGADQPRPEKPAEQWRRPDLGKTGPDGKFTAPTERDPTAMLCLVHESGYFERPFGVYLTVGGKPLAPRTITLQPWGRIEGEVRWKDRPGANEVVELIVMRDAVDYPVIESSVMKIPCDEEGRFVVEGVPPGQVQIFHVSRGGDETPYLHAHIHPTVTAEETTRVIVGGRGRTVSGKLKGLTDYTGLTVYIAPNAPRPGDPDLMAAWSAFARTELGKLYFRDPVAVNADGTFRIDAVLPGYYQVFIQSPDKSIHHVEKLSVPAESPDAAPEPLDMGEAPILPRTR